MANRRHFVLIVTLAAVLGTTARGQTCQSVDGRVSLASLPQLPFANGNAIYTFNFCTLAYPIANNLGKCSTPGYLQINDATSKVCVQSYNLIFQPLTIGSGGVYFIARDNGNTKHANITIMCDRSGSLSTASLLQPVDTTVLNGVETLTVRLLSLAGCNIDPLFCGNGIQCADITRTCIQGMCFVPSCARLSPVTSVASPPANFVTNFAATDCNGTPLPNLPNSTFSVTLNGVNVNDPALLGEAPYFLDVGTAVPSPMITTLLLDQSSSVTSDSFAQQTLINATLQFVRLVSSNPNHYVGLLAFDGSAAPVKVFAHTTDHQSIIDALSAVPSALPPANLPDPDSTNLYGAVIGGLQESNRMRGSFGNLSVSTFLVVFTDGYDTAARTTADAAVSLALSLSNAVRIMSVGVSETSDGVFLKRIATSGYITSVSISALVQSFTDMAQRLQTLVGNTYSLGMCIPMRANYVGLAIALNATVYPSAIPATYTINAANFSSGCTFEKLMAARKSPSSVSLPEVDPLNVTSPLVRTLAPQGAYYFTFYFPTGAANFRVSVSPVLPVYFLRTQRCALSQYCSDGMFNTTFVPQNGISYWAMVLNPGTLTATATLTAGAAITPMTPAPSSLGVYQLIVPKVNLSNSVGMAGDVDNGATIVFFTFGLIVFLAAAGFFVHHICTRSAAVLRTPPRAFQAMPRGSVKALGPGGPLFVSPGRSEGPTGSPHGLLAAGAPSPDRARGFVAPIELQTPHHADHDGTATSGGRKPVFTVTQPYRGGTPYYPSPANTVMLPPVMSPRDGFAVAGGSYRSDIQPLPQQSYLNNGGDFSQHQYSPPLMRGAGVGGSPPSSPAGSGSFHRGAALSVDRL